MTAWRAISTSALPRTGVDLGALTAAAHAIAASAMRCEACTSDVGATWNQLPTFYATDHTFVAVSAMRFFTSGSLEWLESARLIEQALLTLVEDLQRCEVTRASLASDVSTWREANLAKVPLWRLDAAAVREGFALWRRRDALQVAMDAAFRACRMTLARVGADPYGGDPNNRVDDSSLHQSYLDIPLFLSGPDGIRGDQVDQGNLGDCWLMATMASLADQNPQAIRDMILDNGDGTYTVTLWVGGKQRDYVVDGDVLVNNRGAPVYGGNSRRPTALWPLILEKAAAQALGSYGAIESDMPSRAIEFLTGRPADVDYHHGSGVLGFLGTAHDTDFSLEEFSRRVNDEDCIAIAESEQKGEPSHWFGGDSYPVGDDGATLYYGHAYEVAEVSISPDGEGTVTLVNPHNSDVDHDALGSDTDNDVIVVSWDDFNSSIMRVTVAQGS